MDSKWKQLLLVVISGLVIPGIFLSVFAKQSGETSPDASTPSVSVPAWDKQSVWVIDSDDELKVMDMDTYLVGVLLEEMPAEFDLEALKAQAVVARTFALRRNLLGDKHSQKAVCTQYYCCQGYCTPEDYLARGGTQEEIEKMMQAVEETENQVLMYDGQVIDATYFSCSGGRTEDAVAVWGADIPYLQSVESPGEESAGHFTDTVKFTAEEFQQRLGDTLLGHSESWIKSVTYTEGGGVDTIKIGNVIYTGTKIRSLLSLRSTAFVMTAAGDSIIVTTKGFGHRVGMSQYGAEAMAVSGSTYEEILAHYYQGTTLTSWDEAN